MNAKGECRLALAIMLLLGAHGARAHMPREGRIEELDRRVHVGEIQLVRGGGSAALHARLVMAYVQRVRLGGDWADVDRAGAVLAQGLRRDPEHRDLLWAAAQLYAYEHRFDQALAMGERLVRVDPDDPRGWAAAGDALLEKGQVAAARARYERMAGLRRDFAALWRLARVELAAGARGAGASLLRGAVAAATAPGQRRWALDLLAGLEAERGRLDQARTLWEDALLDDMEDDVALKRLADVRALQGDAAAADGLYATAFGIRPDPLYALAWASVKRQLGQRALADTLERIGERALRGHRDAGRVAYLRELALLYLHRGERRDEALQLALEDAAVRGDTEGLEILAWAYQRNGLLAEAWAAVQRAMARPDAGAATHYRAGRIAADLDRRDAARALLERALALDRAGVQPFRAEAARLLAAL